MHQLATLIAALTSALAVAYRQRHHPDTVEAARTEVARLLAALWDLIDGDEQ